MTVVMGAQTRRNVRTRDDQSGAAWHSTAFTVLKRSFQSFGSDKCATLSAAIAYYTVFALFPMALVGVSLLGFFVDDAAARQQVVQGFARVITLGEEGERALAETLQGVTRTRGFLGIVGVLTAAWSASGLFGAIRSALNSVWDVDQARPMLRAKAVDLLLFMGFGGLLALSTTVTGALQAVRELDAGTLTSLIAMADPLFWLLTIVAPLTLTFFAFLFLYKVAPHARLGWLDVLPAAVIAALFFEFGKNGLAFYIRSLGNFNALAGSLGAAILFLVFVYYASQVVLFAAELSKHWLLVRSGALPPVDPTVEGPKQSLFQRVKQAIIGLWHEQEPHHDLDLPYRPARTDPHTHQPTDTRQEVLVKHEETRKEARERQAGTTATLTREAVIQNLARNATLSPARAAATTAENRPPKPDHQRRVRGLPVQAIGLAALVVALVLSRFGSARSE